MFSLPLGILGDICFFSKGGNKKWFFPLVLSPPLSISLAFPSKLGTAYVLSGYFLNTYVPTKVELMFLLNTALQLRSTCGENGFDLSCLH